MGTNLRARLSLRSKYYISPHRRYELKHFCLQYPLWKKALYSIVGLESRPDDLGIFHDKNSTSDPTWTAVNARQLYQDKIDMVEKAAYLADPELAPYIIKGVTEEKSYEAMYLMHSIPCSRKTYYDRYRKFFYDLSLLRK